MSLAWHIARKDLFRLRVTLLLWAVVLTGRMTFALIQAHSDTGAAMGFLLPAWIFGVLFLPLLSVGLVMGVMADDAVCDSDAFWVTRPISGGQLLAAKLLALGLLSLIPGLLTLLWWLAQGYDAGLLATAFLHTLKWQLIVMALAAPVAALSGSNGRFVTNAVLADAAGVTLVLIHKWFAGGKSSADLTASYATCLRIAFGLWLVTTAAILWNQFHTRRTRRSLAIALAAVLIGFAVAAFIGSRPATGSPAALISPTARDDQPARVLAVIAPVVGAQTFHDGLGLRVTGIIPNDLRGMIITVSESSPDFSAPPWTGTIAPLGPPFHHETYFLVRRHDGRSLRGTVAPVGQKLTAATLAYFRHDLTFPLPREAATDLTFNFQTWVADADLVKVGSDDELQDFPRALMPALPPLRP